MPRQGTAGHSSMTLSMYQQLQIINLKWLTHPPPLDDRHALWDWCSRVKVEMELFQPRWLWIQKWLFQFTIITVLIAGQLPEEYGYLTSLLFWWSWSSVLTIQLNVSFSELHPHMRHFINEKGHHSTHHFLCLFESISMFYPSPEAFNMQILLWWVKHCSTEWSNTGNNNRSNKARTHGHDVCITFCGAVIILMYFLDSRIQTFMKGCIFWTIRTGHPSLMQGFKCWQCKLQRWTFIQWETLLRIVSMLER